MDVWMLGCISFVFGTMIELAMVCYITRCQSSNRKHDMLAAAAAAAATAATTNSTASGQPSPPALQVFPARRPGICVPPAYQQTQQKAGYQHPQIIPPTASCGTLALPKTTGNNNSLAGLRLRTTSCYTNANGMCGGGGGAGGGGGTGLNIISREPLRKFSHGPRLINSTNSSQPGNNRFPTEGLRTSVCSNMGGGGPAGVTVPLLRMESVSGDDVGEAEGMTRKLIVRSEPGNVAQHLLGIEHCLQTGNAVGAVSGSQQSFFTANTVQQGANGGGQQQQQTPLTFEQVR